MPTPAVDFIHDLRHTDIPESARHAARRLLLDTVGVAAAGSATMVSRILRDHAARCHAAGAQGPGARLLFDGRRVSPPGSALAGAGTIDSIDAHDGHRLTKGHAGVTVLPALLAFADEISPCGGAATRAAGRRRDRRPRPERPGRAGAQRCHGAGRGAGLLRALSGGALGPRGD